VPDDLDLEALIAHGKPGGATRPATPTAKAGKPANEPERDTAPEPSSFFWLAIVGLSLILGGFAIREHWVPNKWLFGDGAFYMNVARGILENGSLRQESMHPHSWYDKDLGWNGWVDAAWSNIALGRNGEWWPKHPILMPVCSLPFVLAFGPLGTLIFQFLCFALMAVFAWRIASRVASRPAALAATCAFLVTPWVYDRVWGFNNDVFYTVLILAAVDAALLKKAAWAGALLGIGIFAKNTNVLYGPALLAIFLMRKDWRGALKMCLWAAVPALAYLGLNWYLYGSPMSTGYDRILVRENGKLGMHSHRTDFHFDHLKPDLIRVLTGSEGFLGHFPLLFPSCAGLLVMALRKNWREALLFAWSIAVPIAFHAPYAWYRLEFNLPQIALCTAPLAALLPPFAPVWDGAEPRSRVRWGRLAIIFLLISLVGAGFGRRLFAPRHDYLWDHLPQAAVWLGDIPCDYYNNQMERWECSHFDNDGFMTGRPLTPDLVFEGKKQDVLLFAPHSSNKERRLEYANVPMARALKLRYGLADAARNGCQVHFKVSADDQVILEEDVHDKKLVTREIDTPAFAGKLAKLTLAVTAPSADGCVFGVDGSPVR
jgi:hypothetical protein